MRKKFIFVLGLFAMTFTGCTAEENNENKEAKNIKVNSHIETYKEVTQEDELLIIAENQDISSGKIVETEKEYFYSSIKDNNRIYRAYKNTSGMEGKSEVSMLTGVDLVLNSDKVYFSNTNDNKNIYYFETDKFDENHVPTKVNNMRSRNLVSAKDGIYYINEEDNEKIYFISYDGEIDEAITQERAAKFIVSGDIIYFQNADDGYNLYAIDKVKKERYKLTDFAVDSFTIVNKVIVASNSDDNNSIYIIRGTNDIKKISNIYATNIKSDLSVENIVSKEIYFISDDKNLYKMSLTDRNEKDKVTLVSKENIEDYYFTSDKIVIEDESKIYKSIKK